MFDTSLSCHHRIWLKCWIWEAVVWQNLGLYAVQHIFVANFCQADLITTPCTPQFAWYKYGRVYRKVSGLSELNASGMCQAEDS